MKNFVYGLHAVEALIKKSPEEIQTLFIQKERRDQRVNQLIDLAQARNILVQRVAREQLEEYAQENVHQGVVALCVGKEQKVWQEHELENLLDAVDGAPLLLILDGVQDPHNLGACLRSANAAGVHAVIAPKDRAVGITPVVRKVACGAAEITPFVSVTNLARTMRDLKERGIWLYGTDGEATQTLYEVDLKGPAAIVMGAEGEGMRRLTRDQCDFLISIPMFGSVSSLNVSVATGVCLFEVVRQRINSNQTIKNAHSRG